MGDITIPNTFVSNTLIESADVNENFQALADGALNKAGDTATGPIVFQDDVDVGGDLDVTGNLAVTGSITGTFSTAADALTGTTLASNVVNSSLIGTGTVTTGTWSANFGAVSGANLTALNASNLGSGTVPLARLSGITTSQMASAAVSQFSNDAGYLTSASVTGVPTGTIAMWGAAVPPTDWFLCNGAGYSTTTYAALYAVIGYTYGGSGGTFNVPNFQQRFPLGKSSGSTPGATLGETGGSADHTHTAPSHTHSIAQTCTVSGGTSHTHTFSGAIATESAHTHITPDHTHPIGGSVTSATAAHTHDIGSSGAHEHSITVNATGNVFSFGSDDQVGADGTYYTGSTGDHTHTTGAASGDAAHSHGHTLSASNDGGNLATGAGSAHTHGWGTATLSAETSHTHTVSLTASTTGSGGASATSGANPPYLTVNFIIKT